jgi:hypothetical protein
MEKMEKMGWRWREERRKRESVRMSVLMLASDYGHKSQLEKPAREAREASKRENR